MTNKLEVYQVRSHNPSDTCPCPTESEREAAARILALCQDKPIRRITPKDYKDGRLVRE